MDPRFTGTDGLGLYDGQQAGPAPEAVDALLEQVDYSRIHLDGTTLTVPKGMQLDLGAVGKGYTADLAAQVLQEHGVESALLNLWWKHSGHWLRPDGSDWRIGVPRSLGGRKPGHSGNQQCGSGDLWRL